MPDYDQIAQAYLSRFKKPEQPQDLSEEYLGEDMICESRLDWLKKNTKPTYAKKTVKVKSKTGEEFDQEQEDKSRDITFAHDPTAKVKNIPDLIDHIAKHGDPTPNKAHTQWLTNIYMKGNLKQEDLPRAHAALKKFEGTPANENGGVSIRGAKHDMPAEERVINHKKYPTVQSLQKAMTDAGGGLPPSRITDNLHAWQASGRGGIEQIHDDEHTRIFKIHPTEEGKAASKAIYGGGCDKGGTEWCTANHNEEHNYFDHYLKNDYPGSHLYVVHRKSDGEVFQYHTHSDQFMNKNDEQISHEDLKTIQPSLHKMWDAHIEHTDPDK
jgi:hypothetical protein